MLLPFSALQCSTSLVILLLTIGSIGKNTLGIESVSLEEQEPPNDCTHSHDHAATHHHQHHHRQLSRPSSSKIVPQRRYMKKADGSLQRCGTENLSKTKARIIEERIKHMELNMRRGATLGLTTFAFKPVTIDVSFHVLYNGISKVKAGNISKVMVDDQIQVLNDAYAPHGFQFQLRELVRTDNAGWYRTCFKDKTFKNALRDPSDGPNVLYLYTCNSTKLGYSTFPIDFVDDPSLDGVVLLDRSLPGGTAEPYNLGDTAVHEVGHWLGLLHTFHGGCLGGDYVKDTPAQAEPSYGCPVGSDTCPNQTGLDPINNYMDYSDDECLTEFTAGQEDRMQTLWRIYRSPGATSPSVPLKDKVPLKGQALSTGSRRTYTLKNIPFLSQVSVKLSGRNGDADLFVDLCSSTTPNSSNESCTTQPIDDGSVLIEVYASAAFTDMTITANIVQLPWVSLTLGASVNGLRQATGKALFFVVQNVPRETIVQVATIGNSGDADINVYSGMDFDSCVGDRVGSNESCYVSTFLPSSVYITLRAFKAFDDLTLVTKAYPASFVTLSSDSVPVKRVALSARYFQYFVLTNVNAGSIVVAKTGGGTDGDADLVVYVGDVQEPVCQSLTFFSTETCRVRVDRNDNVFIKVQAYSTFSDLTVQADVSVNANFRRRFFDSRFVDRGGLGWTEFTDVLPAHFRTRSAWKAPPRNGTWWEG